MWNPRDLQGSGMAWILGDRPEGGPGAAAGGRAGVPPHLEPFNSHPYLAGVALGALARERAEGRLPPEAEARFRAALRAPLGALGDALVWAGWVPFLVLAALGLLVLGAPALPVVGGFLLAHNVLHLALRRWGVQVGLRHGAGVGAALEASSLRRAGDRFREGVVFLAGFVAALAAVRGSHALGAEALAAAGVAAGGLLFVGLGYLMAGRLPVTTPLRLTLLLLAAGWIVAAAAGG
jgi:mannose PTS system EIID component